MKYIVQLKCNLKDYNYLIKKIIQNNITIIDSKTKKDEYFFTIYDDEYNKLMMIDYKKVIIFVHYKGIYNILNFIKINILYEIVTIMIIIIIFLSNYFILKINIHTNDINLHNKIMYYLMDNKIDKYSIKKDFNKINKIKNNLLNKYHDEIEWLEITKNGYIYNIYLIKRTKNKPIQNNKKCNYVANKSGTITKIYASKGELLVQENNYINTGDILISGEIKYNDELKTEVCAKGKIYGEVWYEVDVTYPLTETFYKKTKKKRYSLSINFLNKDHKLLKNTYDGEKIVKKIGNNFLGISITKTYKMKRKTRELSEDDATKKALEKARKSIITKSHNKSNILSQNILKKYVNNGTIYMKVLITSEEELGVVESY